MPISRDSYLNARKLLAEQCNLLKYGYCTTRACLRKGNMEKPTCNDLETVELIDELYELSQNVQRR